MKTLRTLSLLCLLGSEVIAQVPKLDWVKQIGGYGEERAYCITDDKLGNVYSTGYFQGTTDFCPQLGIYNLEAIGSSDVYIQKLDKSGSFIWAKHFGGNGEAVGYSLVTDTAGNVFVTGYFQGTIEFYPGTNLHSANSNAGSKDVFILKLNTNGDFVWIKHFGGIGDDVANSIALDDDGNIYTTGYFTFTTDFDPDTTEFNYASNGDFDIFIQKLDKEGNFKWAKQIGGSGNDRGNSIATDTAGNVYTTGEFFNSVDFNPSGPLSRNVTSNGGSDIFIQKLSDNGELMWLKQIGGTMDDAGSSITIDVFGNVLTTGWYNSLTNFAPDDSIAHNAQAIGNKDVFILKSTENGKYMWSRSFGGEDDDLGNSVASDKFGNVYVTGTFMDTLHFPKDTAILVYGSKGESDMFIQKYDTNGVYIWTSQTGGIENDVASSSFVDNVGSVVVTGWFSDKVDFDPYTTTTYVKAKGYDDVFVQKVKTITITIGVNDQTGSENKMTIYPNPFSTQTGIYFDKEQKNITVSIYDIVGKEVIPPIALNGEKSITIEKGNLKEGIYFVRVMDKNKNVTNCKIVIQ